MAAYQRQWRMLRRCSGVCVYCAQPYRGPYVSCMKCRLDRAERMKRHRAAKKAQAA